MEKGLEEEGKETPSMMERSPCFAFSHPSTGCVAKTTKGCSSWE